MQLGMAILVNDDLHNVMRRAQLLVAQRCGRNPALKQTPHITIKQPFHAKALPPIERYFDSLIGHLSAVRVRVGGLAFFEEDAVAYLEVAADPQLETLRRTVLRDLSEQYGVKPRDIEDDRYRFHATLAYGLSAEEFAGATEALSGVSVDQEFAVEAVGLFYYTGEEWIVYKRVAVPGAR